MCKVPPGLGQMDSFKMCWGWFEVPCDAPQMCKVAPHLGKMHSFEPRWGSIWGSCDGPQMCKVAPHLGQTHVFDRFEVNPSLGFIILKPNSTRKLKSSTDFYWLLLCVELWSIIVRPRLQTLRSCIHALIVLLLRYRPRLQTLRCCIHALIVLLLRCRNLWTQLETNWPVSFQLLHKL